MIEFKALLESARKLDPAKVEPDIQGLAEDPRFVALLTWLDTYRHNVTLKLAGASHAEAALKLSGNLSTIVDLLGQLQRFLGPARSGRPDAPEDV